MAVIATLSNHYKAQLKKKAIDEVNDTFKIILMNTTFAFDKDTHATLADVTADQLATGNGYTQDNKALTTPAVAEDDTNDRARFSCDPATWTAAGGAIGPSGAAIIYDDTTADDTVVGCIDFGSDITIGDGVSFQISGLTNDLT